MCPKVGYTAAGIPVNTATEPSAWEEMSGAGAWTNENLGPRPGDRMLELTLAIEPVLSCFLLRYIPCVPTGPSSSSRFRSRYRGGPAIGA